MWQQCNAQQSLGFTQKGKQTNLQQKVTSIQNYHMKYDVYISLGCNCTNISYIAKINFLYLKLHNWIQPDTIQY